MFKLVKKKITLQVFLEDADQQLNLSTIRSLLKLYSTMPVEKLANFLEEQGKERCLSQLMCLKVVYLLLNFVCVFDNIRFFSKVFYKIAYSIFQHPNRVFQPHWRVINFHCIFINYFKNSKKLYWTLSVCKSRVLRYMTNFIWEFQINKAI